MPYIIKTSTPKYHSAFGREVPHLTHTAVATLDEARAYIGEAHRIEYADGTTARDRIGETGGTVGPLPDGTIIEVQRVEWSGLALQANLPYPAIVGGYAKREPLGNSARQILAAFNAR